MNEWRALSLDAMGTLIDLRVPFVETYRSLLIEFGHESHKVEKLSVQQMRNLWKDAEAALPLEILSNHLNRYGALPGYRHGFWSILWETMYKALGLPVAQYEIELERSLEVFGSAALWQLLPQAGKVLEKARANGVPLVLASNFDERLVNIVKELRIQHYFQKIVVSARIGREKPSPLFFKEVEQALSLPRESILHVGDSLENDFEGARSYGFQAALVKPDGSGWESVLERFS